MVWAACKGLTHIKPIYGTLFRLVESQEQVATLGYVDTLEEQTLLEEMLEQVKPSYPSDIDNYHYLLITPFRYPPLRWGSRFGRTSETSLFYAGCSPATTLAESAFYRLVFLDSMEGVTEEDKIRSEHTLFSVDYQSNNGVKLHAPPFNQYRSELTHSTDYSHAQHLGSDMRAAGVTAFEYESARDSDGGLCVALFNTSSFCQKAPSSMTQWLCETSLQGTSFKQLDASNVAHFSRDAFLINGDFPLPA